MRYLFSVFVVLHGLVHLWYVTLSRGWVPFEPAMGWTGRSWLLTPLIGSSAARTLAGGLFALAALLLLACGVGIALRADWWRPLLLTAAAFSMVVTLLFWDGDVSMLVQKGLLGVLINIGLLLALWLG